MREIKFRVYDPVTKEMLGFFKGSFTLDDIANGCLPQGFFEDSGNGGECLRDDLIWLQFTGLKDKNGTEIYEDDILSTPFPSCPVGSISFGEGAFRLRGNQKNTKFLKQEQGHSLKFCKVIGNKWENPELLEGESR